MECGGGKEKLCARVRFSTWVSMYVCGLQAKGKLTCALSSSGSTSLLCSMAVSKDCRKSDTMGSTTFLLVLYFSWIIFSKPHFFTVPIRVSSFSKDEKVRFFALLAKGYNLMKLTQQSKWRGAFPSSTPGPSSQKRLILKHHAEPIYKTRSEQSLWTPLTVKGATVGTSAFLPTLI